MSKLFLKFQQVRFSYESAGEPVFQQVSFHLAPGWSGVVGANGTGKTTLLKLAVGELDPDSGVIDTPRHAVYCPQRTDEMPAELPALIASDAKAAHALRTVLGIGGDWGTRWETLSHGERKRAQIAVALWREPDLLAIDEPTNHLDSEARDQIARALASFDGIGLLVSHDRDLLDSLCHQCLFVEPPAVVRRPGGVTEGMASADGEQQALRQEQTRKMQAYQRLQREATQRQQLAEQSQRQSSKRKLSPRDHDGREKVDRGRVSGKDAIGGNLKRQLAGRLRQAQQQAEAIRPRKEYQLGISLPGVRSRRDLLLHLPEGRLPLGDQKELAFPALHIRPDDRIALTGPNGAGKSTLIRHIVGSLRLPEEQVTYIPQEIDAAQSQRLLNQVRELPPEQLGRLMTIISRLGSRPHRVLESAAPSPGETRKLLLALGMTYAPHIIIMDEPTNHLDLPSIRCLEQALAGCDCCRLLVSHDRRFLGALATQFWHIDDRDQEPGTLALHVGLPGLPAHSGTGPA